MLNAMILNAVEASDYQTAQAIFETARLHGLRRDTITYSTLLKIAFQNLDQSLVERVMRMAEEDGALPRNNKLVSCLVATVLQISRSIDPGIVTRASRYRAMLRIYERYCDTGPLSELGIYIKSDHVVETAGQVYPPSSQLLSTMIVGYIFLFGRHQDVVNVYHRYEHHVANNHHLIAPIAATDHTANAFLLWLGRHRPTYAMSLVILKNMLEPSSSAVARPTVQSWSIVADTLYRNRQPAAAARVIEMMREKGITPNKVTWNTIIAGHAGMQDAVGAVRAMREMEKADLEVNSYTLKALTMIKDRDRLLDALRRTAAADINTETGQQDLATPVAYESSFGNGVQDHDGLADTPNGLQLPFGRESSPTETTDKPGNASYRDRDFLRSQEKPFDDPSSLEAMEQSSNNRVDDVDHLYDIHDTQPGVM
ncbi:MAG: hypothetical protein Q9218_000648 [Villophora microphyllina]